MAEKAIGPIPAEPVNTDPTYSLEELSNACNVETTWVTELVEHGIIEARGASVAQWRFSSVSVVRLAKAKRFERDLGVNPAGIAVVFDLLNEIDRLKSRLNVLTASHSSPAGQPDDGEY
jgi:chaperone modulatory protein CbpM